MITRRLSEKTIFGIAQKIFFVGIQTVMHIELFYALEQNEGHLGPATLKNDLIKILATIESEHSINKAAGKLETSYRYLWGCVLKWEAAFGQTLVNRERGKPASLTPLGRKLLWAERSVQAKHAVNIARIVSELNTAFAVASDPNAEIVTVAGCYDSFLSSLQDRATKAGLIIDYHFSTGCEGLRALNEQKYMVAGFNFPEFSERGSEACKTFSPLIKPDSMFGCHVCRRSQGLVVAKGNPLNIEHFQDIFDKELRYAARSSDTGTYTLQEELLRPLPYSSKDLEPHSTVYRSHMAVATAVASGEADTGLCVAEVAQIVGADFIPLVWENYYLAWMKKDTETVIPLMELLKNSRGSIHQQQEGRDLSQCGEFIEDWRDVLDWF